MDSKLKESAQLFADVLDRNQTFLLAGHVNIDGDSLGSMLGMHHFLLNRGKQVRSIVFEPVADRYSFLGAEELVEVFDPTRHAEPARDVDVFMMFDFSSTGRIPGLWDLVRCGRAFKVCVDHHPAKELVGDLNFHQPGAPATGKILLELIRAIGGEVTPKMAEALFVAISTDTGWFRYANTTPEVIQVAASLLRDGLDASRIYRGIYQCNDVPLIRLMGRVVSTLHAEMSDRLLWATIPLALIRELRTGPFETDELLDLMRTGKKAECVALFRELPDGNVRMNLRSRGQVDVSALAQQVGGGGHLHAAGATLDGPLDEAASRIVTMLRKALSLAGAVGSSRPPQPSRLGR
ncbi:MAG: DHH family phosphoesterase [Planctomycetota bacterium]